MTTVEVFEDSATLSAFVAERFVSKLAEVQA